MTDHKAASRKQLERDEGKKYRAYKCTSGYWTIAIGHNLQTGPKLSETAIEVIFDTDWKEACDQIARRIPWATFLDPVRHGVLVNMCFNMGIDKLLKFKNMLAALRSNDWETAARECADPHYVAQVGDRAWRLKKQIETGEWQ